MYTTIALANGHKKRGTYDDSSFEHDKERYDHIKVLMEAMPVQDMSNLKQGANPEKYVFLFGQWTPVIHCKLISPATLLWESALENAVIESGKSSHLQWANIGTYNQPIIPTSFEVATTPDELK